MTADPTHVAPDRLPRSRRRKAQAAVPPRKARRPRLGGARQAGRHDLDPRGRRGEAAVPGQERRPCRHARSARVRLPADRARRGHQDRPVRDGRPQDPTASPCAGARSATPTTPTASAIADQRPAARRARRSRRCCRPTPARSRRCRRSSRPSRSQGERAYDLARDGETVELQARPVEIHRLTLVNLPDADHAEFEAECGKGTYVRSLARDMGRALGCYGHIVRPAAPGGRRARPGHDDFAGTTHFAVP